MTAEVNFVRQQGIRDALQGSCGYQYRALMWQPRAIGILVVVGLLFQSWQYFLAMAAVLCWSAALPSLNPFDALYNSLIARRRGLPLLGPARGPRRFAQALAGTFMFGIGSSLLFGWSILAWAIEGLLVIALAALIFGRFCVGSYLFLLLTGEVGFANRTLPWIRAE